MYGIGQSYVWYWSILCLVLVNPMFGYILGDISFTDVALHPISLCDQERDSDHNQATQRGRERYTGTDVSYQSQLWMGVCLSSRLRVHRQVKIDG